MEFLSPEVQKYAVLFQTTAFGAARTALLELLSQGPEPRVRAEALSLLLRINIERDEAQEMEEILAHAKELLDVARREKLGAALYHLGVVLLLAEDFDLAEVAFFASGEIARNEEERGFVEYGLAAVLHNRKQREEALKILETLREKEISADLRCLARLLEGNCLKGLGRFQDALSSYLEAQKCLSLVEAFYLKNWVFFVLGTAYARAGDKPKARALFEVVLSITHPVDFRRLHQLARAEQARLESEVEVLFDPLSGDLVCGRGLLSLRRKPILISILSSLIESWPNSLSKESLYLKVWRGEYHPLRHDGLIYSHMQRLRQILAGDSRLKDFVVTTQDGYRLSQEIRAKLKDSEAYVRMDSQPSRFTETDYET